MLCVSQSWSQTWLLCVMYRQYRILMLSVLQSPAVRHGCCVWCINSAELWCCVSCSLLMLQWKSDADKATQIIQSALDIDPLCEYAYEILGTICVQKSVFHLIVWLGLDIAIRNSITMVYTIAICNSITMVYTTAACNSITMVYTIAIRSSITVVYTIAICSSITMVCTIEICSSNTMVNRLT